MRNAVLACLAAALSAATGLAADTLDAVLARMNQEAVSFRQITARLKKKTFTAVLNDTTQETGALWLKRSGTNVQMRTEIDQPDPRSIGLDGSTGQIFYPKLNTVQIYDMGKNRGLVEQFLLLGFGSSGRELEKSYAMRLAGDETVDGRKAAHLILTPKSKQALEQVKQIELWIPDSAGHPVQQKFLQPGGDYYLVSFSDIRLNPNLPDSAFRLQLPANVKKDYPQK
jgi:outer membrane lipoprotein-sorting protein